MKTNMKWVISIACLAALAVALFGQAAKQKSVVSVEEAHAMLVKDSTLLVLDVRTPEEYEGELGHIEHAVLLPVQELEKRLGELKEYKGTTILAVCRSGRRSASATEILTKSGFTAINIEGGMLKWNEKKLPVVKEGK